MSESNTVFIPSTVDQNGDQYSSATLTSEEDQREKIVLAKPYVIPVLFIPGIMGTNLRKKEGKSKAWSPPNLDLRGGIDVIVQLFIYLFKNTKERADDLATETVEIDPGGPIDAGDSGFLTPIFAQVRDFLAILVKCQKVENRRLCPRLGRRNNPAQRTSWHACLFYRPCARYGEFALVCSDSCARNFPSKFHCAGRCASYRLRGGPAIKLLRDRDRATCAT